MKKLIDWIKTAEMWVWRKTDEHPAWNALTWLGHAGAVVLMGGAAGLLGAPIDVISNILPGVPTDLAPQMAGLTATTVAGFYFWRELVEIYRGQHTRGGKVWVWVDHILDAAAPIIAGLWFF